ncbi:peptidylprolyl isomerase [Desulfovibrio litoralis]|uniref:Peptidyl-prolyl cis-trans isomerase n=1 Tax=Desulfovibrio litoralis DSM 11393 TaxID=1121455 RepID=A0A1M7S6X0_9BACT|nr:peptidylprolyl isomerase [Desulfovibrio litoralis]SHN54206.1 peptidyl-prolyl cis-trans isomerase B (cyclophilin B) [Desulfovibrio litoralis DSM 11393]
MKGKSFILNALICGLLLVFFSFGFALAADNPRVKFETSMGDFVVELYPDKAPLTVENFLQYVNSGFYNGTIFHRVIEKFMIQGGGFTTDMRQKETTPPVKNEANNGLGNNAYTIAMARTNAPHSATAQFFINTVDNDFLNFKSETSSGWGYAVFGKVVDGKKVIDKIKKVGTRNLMGHQNVPVEPVIINKASVLTK